MLIGGVWRECVGPFGVRAGRKDYAAKAIGCGATNASGKKRREGRREREREKEREGWLVG